MSTNCLHHYGINGPEKGRFIVDLSSKYCKCCKALHTILEKFRNDGIIEVKQINIDENSKLAKELDIHALPALIFFKDGKLLNKNILINEEIFVKNGVMMGAFNGAILKEVIEQM